jgi:hypothetical protein
MNFLFLLLLCILLITKKIVKNLFHKFKGKSTKLIIFTIIKD